MEGQELQKDELFSGQVGRNLPFETYSIVIVSDSQVMWAKLSAQGSFGSEMVTPNAAPIATIASR